MYSFLVLGIIPGTNLQITFKMWLDSVALAIAAIGIWYLVDQHQPEMAGLRQPLHASQLHLRAL